MTIETGAIGVVDKAMSTWRIGRASGRRLGMLVTLVALGLYGQSALAAPITADLTITGSASLDTANTATPNDPTTQTGDLELISGGATSNSTISGATVTGANPLSGGLTQTGDGVGTSVSIAGDFDGTDASHTLFVDLVVDIANTSATDRFKITFKVEFGNAVDADGADAFADSEFTIDEVDVVPVEVFFTDLLSDTFFGDAVAGVSTGTFGDPQSDSGAAFFDIIIDPGMTTSLAGLLAISAGAFATLSTYSIDFSALLTVDSVMNITQPPPIPEPGSLALFGTGLLMLGLIARRRRARRA